MRPACALAVLVLAAAGCGDSEGEAERRAASGEASIPLPAELARACEDVAADATLPVLCPSTGLSPAIRLRVVHADLDAADSCLYRINLEAPPGASAPAHVVFGGICDELDLVVRDGVWDVEPPVSLKLAGAPPYEGAGQPPVSRPQVLARTTVRGRPGLLVQARRFPQGGSQGGHTALVWNEGGVGYSVSVHFAGGDRDRPASVDERRALERLAASLRTAGR